MTGHWRQLQGFPLFKSRVFVYVVYGLWRTGVLCAIPRGNSSLEVWIIPDVDNSFSLQDIVDEPSSTLCSGILHGCWRWDSVALEGFIERH